MPWSLFGVWFGDDVNNLAGGDRVHRQVHLERLGQLVVSRVKILGTGEVRRLEWLREVNSKHFGLL